MISRNLQNNPKERHAGVCLHITSLPGNYGIGEISESAFSFIDFIADTGLRAWQFLPTGPTGFGNSPYQSFSTFAGNEMLIDIGALVRTGMLANRETASLEILPHTRVAFDRLIPRKEKLLKMAASRFIQRATSDLKAEYEQFLQMHDEPWLHDYALFRVLKSKHGEKEWLRWPARYRHRDEATLRKIVRTDREALEQVKVIQFLFDHQWKRLQRHAREKGVLLFGDMPIYVAMDSADAWASPELLQLDAKGRPKLVAGVPPDYFSRNGQLWGNPVYDWPAHAATKYSWWLQRFDHYSQLLDVVRIDHFRGFESFYAIARGAKTARKGQWYEGPGDAFFRALDKSKTDISVVAEDLGVITPAVNALRRRHRIPGMKVLQFEVLRECFDITEIEADCVCYTGTHDNDTTVGWYKSNPGGKEENSLRRKIIREACGGRASTIHRDMIRLAFDSAAQLAIAPLQDFAGLGTTARLNTPGTAAQNWRWRLRPDRLNSGLADIVARLVDDSGRRWAR